MDRVPKMQLFCAVGVLAATVIVIALRPRTAPPGPITIKRPDHRAGARTAVSAAAVSVESRDSEPGPASQPIR